MNSKFHRGISYEEYLKQIHQVCRPLNYLEIGTGFGATLALARCPALAIDPVFQFRGNAFAQRSETHLFQMKSDDFFVRHDPKRHLGGSIDFAYLDGMHLFEFLLRDLINVEKNAHTGTIIAMHDCYPVNAEIADREVNHAARKAEPETRSWWTGDVWKLLPILRELRPDLRVLALDCPPTGLVIVQGLNPESKVLSSAYLELVGKYHGVTLESFGIERFRELFPTTDSNRVFEPEAMLNFLGRR
jgi:hypothetical protein